MTTLVAPGWSADWLPAYLGALGVTRLLPGARLSWTDDAVPVAVLDTDSEVPVVEDIATAVPDVADLQCLAIARHHVDSAVEFARTVDAATFRDRAALSRASRDGSLEATVTDLASKPGDALEHGPLDPPVPKGITLHQRLVTTRERLGALVSGDTIEDSASGRAPKVPGNGLGFDIRRLDSAIQAGGTNWVDPVTEVLAFYGILAFPVRTAQGRVAQRGWERGRSADWAFSWPAWSPPLDRWAIDALLDRFYGMAPRGGWTRPARRPGEAMRLSIHAAYASLSRQPRGSADPTRGIASERMW